MRQALVIRVEVCTSLERHGSDTIVALFPEPAATAFAVAAFMGLRHGEIQGLLWENYHSGEIHVSRSIWNGTSV